MQEQLTATLRQEKLGSCLRRVTRCCDGTLGSGIQMKPAGRARWTDRSSPPCALPSALTCVMQPPSPPSAASHVPYRSATGPCGKNKPVSKTEGFIEMSPLRESQTESQNDRIDRFTSAASSMCTM